MTVLALMYRQLKVGAANFLVHQWIEQQKNCSSLQASKKLCVAGINEYRTTEEECRQKEVKSLAARDLPYDMALKRNAGRSGEFGCQGLAV